MLLTTDFLLSLFQVINGYIKKKLYFWKDYLEKNKNDHYIKQNLNQESEKFIYYFKKKKKLF